MRKPPSITPPAVKKRVDDETITLRRRYEVITPLFGGGVEPAQLDQITPIRGSAIRGHLRFWWRACQGGQFGGSLKEMKEAEGKLWGAASTEKKPYPSQVLIEVETLDKGQPFREDIGSFRSNYSYVGFPLRDKRNAKVQQGIKFKLIITFPETSQAEIEAALWAWETFGGLGARTRRGFGALQCTSIDGTSVSPYNAQNVRQEIRNGLKTHVQQGKWPPDVPHLTRNVSFKVTYHESNALAAWRYLITELKDFRQGQRSGHFGRTKWPEPDVIRRRVPYPTEHSPLSKKASPDKVPRADFGLPIVFHFNRDEKIKKDAILQGKEHDRLASPLILRPLACANNKAVGIALILEAPRTPPSGLILKDVPQNRKMKTPKDPPVDSTLTQAEAHAIKFLNGQTDVLQAFLDKL